MTTNTLKSLLQQQKFVAVPDVFDLLSYGMACLGGVLVGLPLLHRAALDCGRGTTSVIIGGVIVLLALAHGAQPNHWLCWTEFILGVAVVLLSMSTGQSPVEYHWRSLAVGIGVTVLATIADDLLVARDEHRGPPDERGRSVKALFRRSTSRDAGGLLRLARQPGRDSARREILYSPRRDGPREWIWSALGIPPGRLLETDLVERRLRIGGQFVPVYLFVAILSYSRRLYVRAYLEGGEAAWLDGLEQAFSYYGGVPAEVLFRNPRVCFRRDPKTDEIRANKQLRSFAAFWRFRPRPGRFDHKPAGPREIAFVEESAKAGYRFSSCLELQGYLDRWISKIADPQSDPDGIEAPAERFMRAEAAALQPLGSRHSFRRSRRSFVGCD
jgi:hypothetical protein